MWLVMYSVEFTKVHAINEGRIKPEISPPLKNRCRAGQA